MKKIFAFLAVATLALALNGCGKKDEPAKPTDPKGSVSQTAVPTAPATPVTPPPATN
ncbi:MAG: hypothetical protein ABIH86_02665 [Planctomycetota bacterium]